MNIIPHKLLDKYKIKINGYKSTISIQSELSIVHFCNHNYKKYVLKNSKDPNNKRQEKNFIRELNILIRVRNPAIIPLRGFSDTFIDGSPNPTIVLDYMKNGSLHDFRTNKNLFDATKRQIIMVGIAFGMMILHKNLCIHRDLKPLNILLDDFYRPLICDFGVSKFFDIESELNQSIAVGSCYYQAPEVNSSTYGTKVDVYSFGVILYEIVNCNFATREKLQNQTLRFNPDVSEELKELIIECISIDPDERPTFEEIFKKLVLNPYYYNEYRKIFEPEFNEEFINSFDLKFCLTNVNIDEFSSYVNYLLNETKKQNQEKDNDQWNQTTLISQEIFSLIQKDYPILSNLSDDKNQFLQKISNSLPKNYVLKKENIKSFVDIFKIYNFEVDLNYLVIIISFNELFIQDGIFEMFSLYSFLSWISINKIFFENKKIANDYSILFSILNHIISNSSDPSRKKYHELAISCLIEMVNMVVEKNYMENIGIFMDEISDLFANNNDLPEHSDDIILIIAYRVIRPGCDLDEQSIRFIKALTCILDKNPNSLNQYIIFDIIQTLEKFIIDLNIDCLELFYKSSNYFEKTYFSNIVDLIIDKAYDIMSLEVQNNKEILNKNLNHKDLEIVDINNIFYPTTFLDQMNDINHSNNNNNNFKSDDLISFFNGEKKTLIELIGKIIISKEEYAISEPLKLLNKSVNICEVYDLKIQKKKIEWGFYEKSLFFFYLISCIIENYPKNKIIYEDLTKYSLLDNQFVFDPKLTYFQTENIELLISLRHFIFQFLIIYDHNVFSKILNKYYIHPDLFYEFIYQIEDIYDSYHNNDDYDFISIADSLITFL